MDEIIIENIKGRSIEYSRITALNGYCFYDKDEEVLSYMDSITTPVTDPQEIAKKYIVIKGNAEELNKALEKERTLVEE